MASGTQWLAWGVMWLIVKAVVMCTGEQSQQRGTVGEWIQGNPGRGSQGPSQWHPTEHAWFSHAQWWLPKRLPRDSVLITLIGTWLFHALPNTYQNSRLSEESQVFDMNHAACTNGIGAVSPSYQWQWRESSENLSSLIPAPGELCKQALWKTACRAALLSLFYTLLLFLSQVG